MKKKTNEEEKRVPMGDTAAYEKGFSDAKDENLEVQVALEAYCALIRSSKAHPNKEGLASIAFEFAAAFVKVGKNLGKL